MKLKLPFHVTRWDLIEAWEGLAGILYQPLFFLTTVLSFFLRRLPVNKRHLRIGIFMFAGIGDHLFVLPLLAELKKKYPDSRISVITNAGFPHEWNSLISETIPLQGRMLPVRQVKKLKARRALFFVRNFGLLLKIMSRRLDLGITIGSASTYANLGAFLFYYAGAKQRLGSEFVDADYVCYLSSPPRPFPHENVRTSYLMILPWIEKESRPGVFDDYSGFLRLDLKAFESQISPRLSKPDLPRVVIHPGGKQGINLRQWPPERYRELVQRILGEFDVQVFVTGAADEREMIGGSKDSDGRVVNLCGQTTLPALFALLKSSLLVVSNDTAVLHMAGAVHARNIIGIFGPTTPRRVMPLSPGAQTVKPGIACAPCISFDAADAANRCSNPDLYACIYETGVDSVWRLVREVLLRELKEKRS